MCVCVFGRGADGGRRQSPWDRRADGHVVSLETHGEAQVCNLPTTTGGHRGERARAHTRMHTDARAPLTGCNLPGAYGWPAILLHLSYTKTAQTQFTLPAGEGESETNFLPVASLAPLGLQREK